MRHNQRILITGAGGFIGGWLAETLFLTGVKNVRAGIHSWSSAARLARFPVEIVLCDVTDKGQIAAAMEGVTHVIHCAKGSYEATIEGTRNVLEAAATWGVRHLVHLSTTEVYGHQTGSIDETFPFQPTGQTYGDSKIEAETVCREFMGSGLPITVVRPSIVYGPFSKDWTVRLAQKLQSGYWGLFKGYGDGKCNLIYVSDLVNGILLALDDERAIGQTFNMTGPEIITWNEYFARFSAALHLPNPRMIDRGRTRVRSDLMEPLRSGTKFALAHFGGTLRGLSQRSNRIKMVMRATERRIKSTPRPQELELYNREAVYLNTKMQQVLGFKPRIDVDTGLAMTVQWLEHLELASQTA